MTIQSRIDTGQLAAAILRQEFPLFFRRVFQALDPGTVYVPNWHYLVLGRALQRILSGETRRLIINVPPRSGKSIMASVAWPMFVLGHHPARRVICVSHTEDLARKFSIDRGAIAKSDWYQRLFPAMRLNSSRPRDLELTTTERGSCFAAGVGVPSWGAGPISFWSTIRSKPSTPYPRPSAAGWRSSTTTRFSRG